MVEIIGKRKPRIYFALGIYKYWEFESQASIVQAQQERKNWELGKWNEIYGMSNITCLRNIFANDFLDNTKDDYFFTFDADIQIFTPCAIDIMLSADKEIIGAPYIYRKSPFKPTFVTFDNSYDLRGKKEPFKVKYASGGFTLISRRVLKKIQDKYGWDIYTTWREGDIIINEDWSIQERARRDFNIDTWLDPRINLGHIGNYPYTMDNYYAYYLDRKE